MNVIQTSTEFILPYGEIRIENAKKSKVDVCDKKYVTLTLFNLVN